MAEKNPLSGIKTGRKAGQRDRENGCFGEVPFPGWFVV